jgi:hypothetical protein
MEDGAIGPLGVKLGYSSLDAFRAAFEGKWFASIFDDLERLQQEVIDVAPQLGVFFKDDTAEWAFNCLAKPGLKDAGWTVLDIIKGVNAIAIGKILGGYWSMAELLTKLHEASKTLTPEFAERLDAAISQGITKLACNFLNEASDWFPPRLFAIKRRAFDLATKQGGSEEREFLEGYNIGAGYVDELGRRVKPLLDKTAGKAMLDDRNRNWVYLFALLNWQEIEGCKEESGWEGLHEKFKAFCKYDLELEMDEETFKKILQRVGLQDVGKRGKKPMIEYPEADRYKRILRMLSGLQNN